MVDSWCPRVLANLRSNDASALRRSTGSLKSRASGTRQRNPAALTNAGDSLPQPRMSVIVVVGVLPNLRIFVARELDGRLDDPKAGHPRQDLCPACGQRRHVVG